MKVTTLDLDGLLLVQPTIYRDERGFFVERFQTDRFRQHGLPTAFFQDNHSRSQPRVVRGMHYQNDPAQGKLVGVIRGAIWDVAVDIRKGSPTFGRSVGIELNDAEGQLLWIPAGFAHGFCVLGAEPADVLYKTDAPYNPKSERGMLWNDPELGIPWPVKDPILSARDAKLESFAQFRERLLAPQPSA